MIYLDVDGVLADFFSSAVRKFASPAAYDAFCRTYPRGEWDIPKVLGIPDTTFWGAIDEDRFFWRDLPLLPEARDLYRELRKLDDITFLTSASDSSAFWMWRPLWLCDNFSIAPHDLRLVIVHKHSKSAFAKPGNVLVDDNDRNCSEWGSGAILYPQIWNANHSLDDAAVAKVTWTVQQIQKGW